MSDSAESDAARISRAASRGQTTEWDVSNRHLRRLLGRFRTHCQTHPDRYGWVQTWLDHANVGRTYDRYLARVAFSAVIAAILATFVAGAVVGSAVAMGLTTGLGVTELALWAGVLVLPPIVGGLTGVGVGVGRLSALRWRAYQRRREIDAALPHATLFLYALVHGGADLYQSMDDLAAAEDVYGETAVEFDRLMTELRWLDTDLFTGLMRARDRSPSRDLEVFFEEWENVLETGGDIETFLKTQVETQLEQAQESQQELLEDMEIVAEAYIVLMFAGPIFMFVVLVVVSFIANLALTGLEVLVYGYIPLGLAVFVLVFDHLTGPLQYNLGDVDFGTQSRTGWQDLAPLLGVGSRPESDRMQRYQRARIRVQARDLLAEYVTRIRRRPLLLLLLTVPLSLGVVLGSLLAGIEIGGLASNPVPSTTALLILPLLVTTIPLSILDELNRRRTRIIRDRFPAALHIIADANRNDVPLVECFDVVVERTSGAIATELRRVRDDITWTRDVDQSLRTFADRLGVPAVARTVNVLLAGLQATNDIAPVADIVADDLQTRNKIRQHRRERLQAYVVVVVVGVLVYLAIVILFDQAFFPIIERFSGQSGAAMQRSPIQLGDVSVLTYRRLLFHSALIQAFGNGLVLGKLTDNRLMSGLKYANLLVIVVLVVFVALP